MTDVTSTPELTVVETGDDWWLGSLKVEGDTLTIVTHRAGRPKLLDLAEVESVTPAHLHPHVVGL